MQSISNEAIAALINSHSSYVSNNSKHYDEVFNQVCENIEINKSIGKIDVGALLFWKRITAATPWVRMLMILSDEEVRAVTRTVVRLANDEHNNPAKSATSARSELSQLPGFKSGDALASALLYAAAPKRMAVYDRRAESGLKKLNISVKKGQGHYGRYIQTLEDIRSQVNSAHAKSWIARDVDVALFDLGGQ